MGCNSSSQNSGETNNNDARKPSTHEEHSPARRVANYILKNSHRHTQSAVTTRETQRISKIPDHLTTPAAINESHSVKNVFELFGMDKDQALEETKNASVLGTLKSPPNQYCENTGLRWGFVADQGQFRPYMEDRCVTQRHVNAEDRLGNCLLFGILDGHGGGKAVDYIMSNFHINLFSIKNLYKSPSEALLDCYSKTDLDLLKHFEKNTELDEDGKIQINQSGCTAVFLLVIGGKFYLSHIGDSTAIISEKGHARVLCEAHEPSTPSEKARIEKAGGAVVDGRIYRSLAVSRAFGDYHLKTSRGPMQKKFNGDIVISLPEINDIVVDAVQEFIVLTSDGIISVMNPQSIVNFVKERLLLHSNVQTAAIELVKKASIELKCEDNVSAVIIVFHQWGRAMTQGSYRYSSTVRSNSKVFTVPPAEVMHSSRENLLERTYSSKSNISSNNPPLKDFEDYLVEERRQKISYELDRASSSSSLALPTPSTSTNAEKKIKPLKDFNVKGLSIEKVQI